MGRGKAVSGGLVLDGGCGGSWDWVVRVAWKGLGCFDEAGLDKGQAHGTLELLSLGSFRNMVSRLVGFN